MSSLSHLSYGERASRHSHPVAERFFETAEAKKSNLIVSADFSTTEELLDCADTLGPYMAVLKTHIDLLKDLSDDTLKDRKFVDIGNTVQRQYRGGALRISEFADVVNVSILGGEGIVEALSQVVAEPNFPYSKKRAFIILADMTSKGSMGTGIYTRKSVELARTHNDVVIGFIATKSLTDIKAEVSSISQGDFITFTIGINQSSKGDKLGQQYNTPTEALRGGSDFIIRGRGVYASKDHVESAKSYQKEGWEAYLARIGRSSI